MRARMAIAASGLMVELREVVLKKKPEQFIETSPKATVPVLVLGDGSVLDESLDILDYVLSESDPAGWKNFPDEGRSEMVELIAENDFSFKSQLDRYKYADRYPEETQDVYRARCIDFLAGLEARLQRQTFLFAQRVSYADIAIFPFVRQFAKVDEKWFATAPYPALRKWLMYFTEGHLFGAVMKKYKPWTQSSAFVTFPEQKV